MIQRRTIIERVKRPGQKFAAAVNHGGMKADGRIAIKNYRRPKNLQVPLAL
jgi:hypothetical protein